MQRQPPGAVQPAAGNECSGGDRPTRGDPLRRKTHLLPRPDRSGTQTGTVREETQKNEIRGGGEHFLPPFLLFLLFLDSFKTKEES